MIKKPTPLFIAEFSIVVFLLLRISRLLNFVAKNRMIKTTRTKAATTLEMSNGKLATNQKKKQTPKTKKNNENNKMKSKKCHIMNFEQFSKVHLQLDIYRSV